MSVDAAAQWAPTTDVVTLAGRGTIYITVAKAYFMLTGLCTYLVLPRLLSAEEFGLYSVTAGVASIVNAVLITGTVQTVSKFVSQDETLTEAVKRKALQLQIPIGGGSAAAYFLLAPLMAHALNDQRLTDYFRLTALITVSYAFYAIFLGSLNGRRMFLRQAALDASYSTLKLIGVVGLASLGYAVVGALGGWLLASLSVLFLSVFVAGWGKKVGQVRARDVLGFQATVLVFILVVNLLQKVDLLLVKALISSDPEISSRMAGYYNAVMTIANVTFQSVIAVTFVVFPLISEATFRADQRATREYISQTLRFSLIIMALLASLFSSNAVELLGLIYTEEYREGASALGIAPFGMLLFGFLYVITTIVSSSGRPRVSVLIGSLTLLLDALFNAALIPGWGLRGAAMGTALAMLLGAAVGSVYVRRQFGALFPWRSGVSVMVAALGVFLMSRLFPASGLIVPIKLVVQGVVYAGFLIGLKEIGGDEWRAIRRIVAGR